ncbi:hypothetical protein EDI_088260 [Entamoeba dispar SAW760]|uniref:Uncharacterized protein n=1 Tax=Entamoeba dispar (strain ATCC PRA-260 / SAW760) TaxID=370354 RepID=B0ESF5_ENTDS|nr:uncharacterized protein EDI_088260 [Entamoeba dispar SAW760]EDR22541.1 hypothetical protein EDI_088260 [Entamoeba dispar SAW760]|eukprot:EDR22541.1 hypothetical protein EDI_088260 [Entamoeba dispar SAW760]
MFNFKRPHDDIFDDVAAMDILDVYQESQLEPQVNGLLKKFFYTMKDPQYLEWKLNNDQNITTDEAREDLIRNKLESIRHCERISKYLDEQNISLNSFSTWNKKFAKKRSKAVVNGTIPEWVKAHSKKCKDGADVEIKEVNDEVGRLVNGEALEEMRNKKSMLKPVKKSDIEKKPKKPDVKE